MVEDGDGDGDSEGMEVSWWGKTKVDGNATAAVSLSVVTIEREGRGLWPKHILG